MKILKLKNIFRTTVILVNFNLILYNTYFSGYLIQNQPVWLLLQALWEVILIMGFLFQVWISMMADFSKFVFSRSANKLYGYLLTLARVWLRASNLEHPVKIELATILITCETNLLSTNRSWCAQEKNTMWIITFCSVLNFSPTWWFPNERTQK